jgi:hypothetical protein
MAFNSSESDLNAASSSVACCAAMLPAQFGSTQLGGRAV